jgi:hypothetical protein
MAIQNPVVVAGVTDDVVPAVQPVPLSPGGASVIVSGAVTPKPAAQSPAAPTAATVGVASSQVVAVNTSRTGLVVVNTSTNTISLAFGANAAILNSGITLNPGGGTWVMDALTFTTQAVNAIASGASSNLGINEFS